MGYKTKYYGTYPSQWSEWEWNFQHSCYVRYRLVNKDDYEWDSYQPQPEPEPELEASEEFFSEQYSEQASEYTSESTSDLHHDATSQSDRDSGYHSDSDSEEGFEDFIDHPESWTVNPFLEYGFPPAQNTHSKNHRHQKKQQSKYQTGLDISRTSIHSDEGFSEPTESWITLFGKHKKEVNLSPTIDYQNQVCYVSHSVLKDLGLWDSRRMGKGKEAWIPGCDEGKEEKVKVLASWTVSWLPTFKGSGSGSRCKMQRTTFQVFKSKKRRVVLGMSPREAKKLGVS